MKEIIYLDTNIMNSMLAQLEEGLINSFSLEQSGEEVMGEKSETTTNDGSVLGGEFKVNVGIAQFGNTGNLSAGSEEIEGVSRTVLEGQKDILNKAFHDYSLDRLMKILSDNEFIKKGDDLKEGDVFEGHSSYKFYDFDLIKKSMDPELTSNIMLNEVNMFDMTLNEAKKIVRKSNPNARERQEMDTAKMIVKTHKEVEGIIKVYKTMNNFSQYAVNLLGNMTVIKADNKIGLLKKEYLRESVESLAFSTHENRKIKYLVRVIGKKDIVFDGFNQEVLKNVNDLDAIPGKMLDIVLGSFEIIEEGDLLVTPIAIYYE